MNSKANAYQQADILGRSQLDLIIRVYDGIIKAFSDARAAFERADNATAYEQLERAKKFLTHLYTTLDTERGGEIAEQLGEMYAFVINEVNVIEAVKDPARIDDNMTIVNNLRMGWVDLKNQLANQSRKEPAEAILASAGAGFTTSA